MARQWFEIDVRSALAAITMPALIMGRAQNNVYPVQHTRYLAEHIASAKWVLGSLRRHQLDELAALQ